MEPPHHLLNSIIFVLRFIALDTECSELHDKSLAEYRITLDYEYLGLRNFNPSRIVWFISALGVILFNEVAVLNK